ncbi:hypothetical protein Bca101_050492 [Brassica carinata]
MDGFTGGGEALALTKLLQYISSIKADCMARQQANDAQLSTMVAEQGMTVMSISVEAGAPRESLSDDKKIDDIRGHMNSLRVDSKHFYCLTLEICLSSCLIRDWEAKESQTKRLKRMFQTRFKIPYQFLDTNPFVDSLVQSDYHLSSEVKHQNFSISEMRRLIKETQYTLLLYIQASHASDWTDNKGNKEEKQSVNNSRRRYIDGEHWFDVEGSQDYGSEFADEIGDGLILRVKVMRCMLIKKSSLEKLLMCKKSIMMFSMIDAKRPVKELRTQW